MRGAANARGAFGASRRGSCRPRYRDGAVHAYQTVTAKAMLDSGANLNVFKSRALPHMTNKRDSKFGVGGLTGGEVQADTFGTTKQTKTCVSPTFIWLKIRSSLRRRGC